MTPSELKQKYGYLLYWFKGRYWELNGPLNNDCKKRLTSLMDSGLGHTDIRGEGHLCLDEAQYKGVEYFRKGLGV